MALGPYIFARSSGACDLHFPHLRALAGRIVAARDEASAEPGFDLRPAVVARGPIESGPCIAVRLCGPEGGEGGQLLGYAFLPDCYDGVRTEALMLALLDAQVLAARAAA